MGKLRGKVVTPGDKGMITYKDASGADVKIAYDQPLSVESGIVMNATVSFVPIIGNTMAVAVCTAGKGEIVDIDAKAGKGVIYEKESGMKYTFLQNYLTESGIVLNSKVTYSLVNSNGVLIAVCLEL